MAYTSTEQVKEVRAALKAEYPIKKGWKFSIRQDDHSSLCVSIMTAPIDFNVDCIDHSQINHYYLNRYTHTDIFQKIKDLSYSTEYYYHLEVGKWDRDFIYIAPDVEEEKVVLEDVVEKTYTQEEVDFLLKQQREHCSFAIGLSSFVMTYPTDYDKFKEIIERSAVDPINLIENHFNK